MTITKNDLIAQTNRRQAVRNALRELGYFRRSYTDVVSSAGEYTELWQHETRNDIIVLGFGEAPS